MKMAGPMGVLYIVERYEGKGCLGIIFNIYIYFFRAKIYF